MCTAGVQPRISAFPGVSWVQALCLEGYLSSPTSFPPRSLPPAAPAPSQVAPLFSNLTHRRVRPPSPAPTSLSPRAPRPSTPPRDPAPPLHPTPPRAPVPHLSRRRPRLPATSASLLHPRPSGARSKLRPSLRSSGSGRRLRVTPAAAGSADPEGAAAGGCDARGGGACSSSPHSDMSRAGDPATAAAPAGRIAHFPLAPSLVAAPRRQGRKD